MADQFLSAATTSFGVYNVTISNTAITLQALITAAGGPTIPPDAKHLDILPEDGDIRWTDQGKDEGVPPGAADPGTAPANAGVQTPTGGGVGVGTGFVAPQGNVLPIRNDRRRILNLKFIRDGAADVHASVWLAG